MPLNWNDWDPGGRGLRRGARRRKGPPLPQKEKQVRSQEDTVSLLRGVKNLFGISFPFSRPGVMAGRWQ